MATKQADLLWKFQLRKEHDQLIALLNTHQEQLSIFIGETHGIFEKLDAKIETVEQKLDRLEADTRILGKERESIYDELRAMKGNLRTVTEDVERQQESGLSSSRDHAAVEKLKEVVLASRPNTRQAIAEALRDGHATASMRPPWPPLENPILSDDGTEDLSATPRLPRPTTAVTSPLNAAKRKQPDAASEDFVPGPLPPRGTGRPTQKATRRTQPDLASDEFMPELPPQGSVSLNQYLRMAEATIDPFKLFQPLSATAESAFVRSFLDGLTSDADKQALGGLLFGDSQRAGPRQQAGAVARWADVKEAVERSGLLEVPPSVAGSVSGSRTTTRRAGKKRAPAAKGHGRARGTEKRQLLY